MYAGCSTRPVSSLPFVARSCEFCDAILGRCALLSSTRSRKYTASILQGVYTLDMVPRPCTAQHRTHSLSPGTKLGLSFSKRLSQTIILLLISDQSPTIMSSSSSNALQMPSGLTFLARSAVLSNLEEELSNALHIIRKIDELHKTAMKDRTTTVWLKQESIPAIKGYLHPANGILQGHDGRDSRIQTLDNSLRLCFPSSIALKPRRDAFVNTFNVIQSARKRSLRITKLILKPTDQRDGVILKWFTALSCTQTSCWQIC